MRWSSTGARPRADRQEDIKPWWQPQWVADRRSRSAREPLAELDADALRHLELVARVKLSSFRFPGPLESEYTRFIRESSKTSRIVLLLLTIALFGSAPLWSSFMLGLPDASKSFTVQVCLSVITPICGAAALLQFFMLHSRITDYSFILAFLSEVVGIEVLRYHNEAAGFYFNPAITAAVPVAVMALARLKISEYLVFALLYVAMIVASDYFFPKHLSVRDPTEWLNEVVLLGISVLGAAFSELAARRGWASNMLLDVTASQDALTCLPNRSTFEQHFDLMTQIAARDRHSMTLALIDLDHFKLVNDSYGHSYGDGVLIEIGLLLSQFARRPADMVARLGGEEFSLLLYDCNIENARGRLSELLKMIRELGIEHKQNEAGVVTVSIGAVAVPPGTKLSDVYQLADEQLYKVKRQGRNNLSIAGYARLDTRTSS